MAVSDCLTSSDRSVVTLVGAPLGLPPGTTVAGGFRLRTLFMSEKQHLR